jgi:PAS domain S-box-containing protein
MAERKRENDGGQGKAFQPKPGGHAYADALGYAEAIIATVREPLVVLEADLRVHTANRSFYHTFRVRPAETEGKLLYDLCNGQWDIPALRKLLGEILPRNTAFNDFEVEHDFPDIGRRAMLLNARKLHREGDHAELILLAIEDVTALREAERRRQEVETRFTEMVKNVRDYSIFLTDPEGRITSWNVAAERIIGYAEAEVVGRLRVDGRHLAGAVRGRLPADAERNPQRRGEDAMSSGYEFCYRIRVFLANQAAAAVAYRPEASTRVPPCLARPV